jgi:hypothetical protein
LLADLHGKVDLIVQVFTSWPMEEFPTASVQIGKGKHFNKGLTQHKSRRRRESRTGYLPAVTRSHGIYTQTQRLSHFSMWEEPPNIPAHFHVKNRRDRVLKGTVPKAFRQRKGHCARFLLAPNSIKQVKERGKRESSAKKIKTCHHSSHGLVGVSSNLYRVETLE